MGKLHYPHLQEPLKIRNLIVKNRIMSAPNMLWRTIDGRPDEYYLGYLEHKARGGAGIVNLPEAAICDGASSHPWNEMTKENLAIYAEIAQAIRETGAAASVELTHGGRNVLPEYNKDPNLIMGPCDYTSPTGTFVRAMTEADMDYVANAYAVAAEYYLYAGFDAVLVHCAHTWLLPQFLSPVINKRTDGYGGSLENRMRFPLYVLKTIRERIGNDKPILMRLSGSERDPEGFTPEDIAVFLSKAQEYVDMAEVSTGDLRWIFTSTYDMVRGHNVPFAEAIKKSGLIRIPVFTAGAILDPQQAEDIIASGAADGVSMARALIADPFLPKKAAAGRTDEIVPCLRCLNCATDYHKRHMICSVNPLIGREARLGFGDDITPAKTIKKVLVVGGGPAGMQAAITASQRGHAVTLIERSAALGGLLRITEKDKIKLELRSFTEYLIRMTKKSNINVLLNLEASEEFIEKLSPDHIIVATGGVVITPPIKGIEKARHAKEIYFDDSCEPCERVVMVGGGLVGVESGLHLTFMGRHVTVLEAMDDFARDLNMMSRHGLVDAVKKSGMNIVTGAKVLEINDIGVIYEKDGETVTVPADTVFYAVGMRQDESLYFDLFDKAPFVTIIGDAKSPGKVDSAIHGGYFAAMNI